MSADAREVREVLEGHLTTVHAKPVSKYIRIFLSSDLTGVHIGVFSLCVF